MHQAHLYAYQGNVNELDELLKADKSLLRLKDGDSQLTLLHVAARAKQVKIIKLLLEHKADIYAGDKENQTAFYLAISCLSGAKEQKEIDRYFEVLKLLLEHEVAIRLEFPQKYPSKHLWLRERRSGMNTFTPESRLKARPDLQKRLKQLIEHYKSDYEKKQPQPVKAMLAKPAVIQDRYGVEAAETATKENNKQQINRAVEKQAANSGIVDVFLSWFNADADNSVTQPLLDKTATNSYESSKKDS